MRLWPPALMQGRQPEHPATYSDPAQLTLTDVNFFRRRSRQNRAFHLGEVPNSFHPFGKEVDSGQGYARPWPHNR